MTVNTRSIVAARYRRRTMMSDLVKTIGKRLQGDLRLDRVPVPVIEECVRQTFAAIEDLVADHLTVGVLGDLESCDACGGLELSEYLRLCGEDDLLCPQCASGIANE